MEETRDEVKEEGHRGGRLGKQRVSDEQKSMVIWNRINLGLFD